MRNFSWKYFTLTGDVESFLLYKEMDQLNAGGHSDAIPEADGFAEPEEAASLPE